MQRTRFFKINQIRRARQCVSEIGPVRKKNGSAGALDCGFACAFAEPQMLSRLGFGKLLASILKGQGMPSVAQGVRVSVDAPLGAGDAKT